MLDKSIRSGREHRKPYRGSKAFDATCRNHGSCDWCKGNRQYKNNMQRKAADDELRAFKKGEYDGG